MSEVKNQALPDRLQAHVMRLANTSMNLSLNDWGPIANDMLEAARLVSAPAPDVPVAEEIEAIRAQFEEASKLGGDPLWMKGHAVIGSLLALSDRLTVERNVLRRELAAHNEGRLGAMRLLDAAREELRKEQVSHLKTRVMLTRIRQKGDGWQDISTAPRDGTQILAIVAENDDRHLANQAGRVFCIRYETFGGKFGGWGVYPGYGGAPDSNFSYWKPVPPTPPKGSEG